MAHKKGGKNHISVSKLSRMSAKDLRKLDHVMFVANRKHETLAVLFPYGQYLEMQKQRAALKAWEDTKS
jgi:hypothetical protein